MRKIFTLLFLLVSFASFSQSTTVVISQIYGAGGNNSSIFNADYVELHNVSTTSQSLSGLSVQYASATSTTNWTGISTLPAATIPAGGYYLVRMSSASTTNGVALPTPDHISAPTVSMSATSGKVALVTGLTALSSCTAANIIDLVGYGTANCSEGSGTAPLLDSFHAAFRNNNGCAETNDNTADFSKATPLPRNSATTPFICTGTTPVPTLTATTVVDFGSVVILTNSPSQSFTVIGSNLTGFPGVITITAPSGDFQVSNDNTTWGANTTIPFTSATLSSTLVYVRFTPQTVGPKSGFVNVTGGGVSAAVTVTVSGNGVGAAVASVTTTALTAFGNVCLNTNAGPNSFTLNGSNLTTADLVVGPLAGYTFSTTSGGTYTPSLTLTHGAGAYTQQIFVRFRPTAVTSYNGSITITGGGLASAANVAVTGAGIAGTPTVTTGSASAIDLTSATISGSLPSQGCSPVTAYGVEYSLISGFANGSGTSVASTNLSGTSFTSGLTGLQPGTTYYYTVYATNAGGTVYGTQLSFITAAPPPPPPPALATTALTAFGSSCPNTTLGPNSFDLSGSNLTPGNITVGPFTGYTFSTTSAGTYTPSLVLAQTGGTFNQTIFVKFTPPSVGTFGGNIPVSGGGVASFSVAATGVGANVPPTVTTGDATDVTSNSAIAPGMVEAGGCAAVNSYGIEYSGINGFISGTGFRVVGTDVNSIDFTSQLRNLVPNTTYYYKAYAVTANGTSYGIQKSFTTGALPNGLIIYSTPIIRGQNMRFSLTGLKPGSYSARIHNSVGQLVYTKQVVIQVGFIDQTITFPAKMPIGLYSLEIRNYEYQTSKTFYVQ